MRWLATLTGTLLAAAMVPSTSLAQTTHARAKAEVEARDKQHHNKLKTEAIPTATGAVAGGVAAGPAGAFAGAKMGHTVGTVFHGVKKHRDIKRVEKHGTARHRRLRRTRTTRRRTTVRHTLG
jgi:ammonia channel protein AmtB